MINELNAKKLQNGNESIAKAINQANNELLLKFGEATARRAMRSALGESGSKQWNTMASTWLGETDHLMTPGEITDRFISIAVRSIAHHAGEAILSYAKMMNGMDAAECAISISLQSIDAAGEIKWWGGNENADAEAMLSEQEEQLKCITGLIYAERLIYAEKNSAEMKTMKRQKPKYDASWGVYSGRITYCSNITKRAIINRLKRINYVTFVDDLRILDESGKVVFGELEYDDEESDMYGEFFSVDEWSEATNCIVRTDQEIDDICAVKEGLYYGKQYAMKSKRRLFADREL